MKPIVITGFMGCGKTRVARELAQRLDVAMIDLDEQITAHTGRTPAQLIVEEGEAAFRAIESEALSEVLHNGDAKVIALGGGAWIQAVNRELIERHDCLSIWLDAPFELCWTRIESSEEDRPLGRSREQALALYHQRRPVYELAKIRVPIQEEDFESLVLSVIHFIR